MDDEDFDELSPAKQKAALARLYRRQRMFEASIKKQVREMSAFVRSNAGAVIALKMDQNVLQADQIGRTVLCIEVDAERFARFTARLADEATKKTERRAIKLAHRGIDERS